MNNADYRDAFDRIREENSVYYLIGYYPTSTRRVGRFYRTEIKVRDRDSRYGLAEGA